MTTARKRWWRAAAIAAVGGIVVTGGWFGLVRAKGQKPDEPPAEAANWTRSTAPSPPAPTVAEVARTPEPAPPTAPVTPAGATLPPIPTPGGGIPVAPAIPVAPPVLVPAAPLPVPAVPPVPPVPPAIQPASGPRLPDPALLGGDKSALPAVPPVPSLPPTELPPLPAPPKEAKPAAPPSDMIPKPPAAPTGMPPLPPALGVPGGSAPALPPLPASTAEPPKALPVPPVPSGGAVPVAPVVPAPGALPLAQPTPLAPSALPVKPADPMQPVPPVKPDSDLNPTNPGNTLNPTVAPAVPIVPPGTGRETPAVPVDRAKPTDPSFNPTDKYVFPVPSAPAGTNPLVSHQRDDTMLNFTTTAAFAVLGGALLAAEKANLPPVAPPAGVIPAPGVALKADPTPAQLKQDLDAANEKIKTLEKQVARLTELLTGKKDDIGLVVPSDPGAVEEIKRLKNRIAELEGEVKTLKTQTALKPAVVPEARPRGIVRIVNEYPVEITMLINDNKQTYRVAPGTKLDVEVPAGEFTYQLLQSGAAPTRSAIKDKETVTLRIK